MPRGIGALEVETTVASSNDPYDLGRFVRAQAPVYATALDELKAGKKRSHWMWFVFPQMRGLGMSSMAHSYGIGSLEEARAYLAHPVLGERLSAATNAVLAHEGRSLAAIFGTPDDMKFVSCMTLFEEAGGGAPYAEALRRLCGGRRDERTLALIEIK